MASRAIYGGATANAAASVSAVEGAGGPGAGGLFYPSPSSGGAMPIGFHGHEVAKGDDWRGCISASVLPLCADLLELEGYRDCVFRDLRGAEWGFAGGAVAVRGGALGTSDGQSVGGHARTPE